MTSDVNSENRKLDVMLVCNYKGVGGAQLNALLLSEEFNKLGYNSEVVFLSDREEEFAEHRSDIKTLYSRQARSVLDWCRVFFRLCALVRRSEPGVVIGFQPISNVMVGLISKIFVNSRVIATQRNPSNHQSTIGRLLDLVFGSIGVYDVNIAVSNAVSASFDDYPNAYRSKLVVVHNATPSLPRPFGSKADLQKKFGMDPVNTNLGAIGRLHPQKNFGFLIPLMRSLPQAHLYLAGEGPDEDMLRQLSEDNHVHERVHFLGSLETKDVADFYSAIDVYLFPSVYEGFGRTLVEALSFGLPIVAHDMAITREVGGDAVMLVPLHENAWISAISAVASSYNPDVSMSQADKFSLSSMVAGYMKHAEFTKQNR